MNSENLGGTAARVTQIQGLLDRLNPEVAHTGTQAQTAQGTFQDALAAMLKPADPSQVVAGKTGQATAPVLSQTAALGLPVTPKLDKRGYESNLPSADAAQAQLKSALGATGTTGAISGVPADIQQLVRQAAQKYGVDEALVLAVIKTESGFQTDAVSRAGAKGLMQLMPVNCQELGVTNPLDPAQNIDAGVRHLKQCLDAFGGDVKLALAAFNAGAGAVKRHGGIPPFAETQAYVPKVLSSMADYQAQLGGAGAASGLTGVLPTAAAGGAAAVEQAEGACPGGTCPNPASGATGADDADETDAADETSSCSGPACANGGIDIDADEVWVFPDGSVQFGGPEPKGPNDHPIPAVRPDGAEGVGDADGQSDDDGTDPSAMVDALVGAALEAPAINQLVTGAGARTAPEPPSSAPAPESAGAVPPGSDAIADTSGGGTASWQPVAYQPAARQSTGYQAAAAQPRVGAPWTTAGGLHLVADQPGTAGEATATTQTTAGMRPVSEQAEATPPAVAGDAQAAATATNAVDGTAHASRSTTAPTGAARTARPSLRTVMDSGPVTQAEADGVAAQVSQAVSSLFEEPKTKAPEEHRAEQTPPAVAAQVPVERSNQRTGSGSDASQTAVQAQVTNPTAPASQGETSHERGREQRRESTVTATERTEGNDTVFSLDAAGRTEATRASGTVVSTGGSRTVENPRDLTWSITNQARLMRTPSSDEFTVAMRHPEVGQLSVRITREAEAVHVVMQTTNEALRREMQAQLPQLEQSLRDHGLQLGGFDLGSSAQRQMGGGQTGQESQATTGTIGANEVSDNVPRQTVTPRGNDSSGLAVWA